MSKREALTELFNILADAAAAARAAADLPGRLASWWAVVNGAVKVG